MHNIVNQSKFGSWHLLPLIILILGLLAIAMSLGTNRISERQLTNFAAADALMDIQILTTTAHLWFEESLSRDPGVNTGVDLWTNLNLAIELSEALLTGGKTEHGLVIEPLKKQLLRLRVERINALLNEFKIGLMKRQQVSKEGIASDQNEKHDAVFREIQLEVSDLEKKVEANQLEIQSRARYLFFGIYFSWALMLCASTWGLWKHASRRLAMEESLRDSNSQLNTKTAELRLHHERLLDLVAERTAELTLKNERLQQEITERKKMHEALSVSQKRYKKLFIEFDTLASAISDPIALLSPDLDVLWTNNISGPCTSEGILVAKGQKCHPLSLDGTLSCEGCSAVNSFSSGHEETSQSVTPDGRIWEVRAYPIKNELGQVTSVLTMSTDITKKVKVQAETMRAAHLASLGELAAGVAHEINNPINGVINYAQMLIDERKKAHEDYDLQNRILKEGRRIAGIVKSLLSFAREGREVREYVDIHEIMSDTLSLSAAQLAKDGIILKLNVSKDLPRIFAHFQQIQQVFLNLINNARYALNQKFATGEENKSLTISAEAVTKNDTRYVVITFFDNGTGIKTDIIHKIFNPFFSTKPRGAGTGLGLSISHGIVTDHGGEIIIESDEGIYTKIDILLPIGMHHE